MQRATAQMVPVRKAGLRDVKAGRDLLERRGVAAAVLEPPGCNKGS